MKTHSFLNRYYLIAILLLLVYDFATGQIIPSVEVEGGYCNMQTRIYNQTLGNGWMLNSDIDQYPIYSNIKLGFRYKKLTFKQNVENYMALHSWKEFEPKQILFTTGIYYDITLKMMVGYEHQCSHPIVNEPLLVKDQWLTYTRGGYDRLFIKIKIL